MNILFLTSRLPFPPNRGDKLRVFNLLKHLSKKHTITLVSFVISDKEKEYAQKLKPYCQNLELVLLKPWQSYLNCLIRIFSKLPLQVSYYRSLKMHRCINRVCNEAHFDAVYAHLFRMAPYAALIKKTKVALDLCDAVSLHMKRTVKYNKSLLWPIYYLEAGRIARYEKELVKTFNRVIFISTLDKEEVTRNLGDVKNTYIISNGVDTVLDERCVSNNHKIPKVAFLGYLSTFYNVDAVLYFYRQILPLVKAAVPEVIFSVIGAHGSPKIKKLSADGSVELHLDLPDVKEELKEAQVFVCPLRIGSGIQNKILEAMAQGIAVVTTDIGSSGLGALRNKEIMVANDPASFAAQVVSLLKDASLRSAIARQGKAFVENNYCWETVVEKFESVFQ